MKRRAARAIVLLIGFYALAIGIAITLLLIAFLDVRSGEIVPKLLIFCIAGAGIILWSIFPRSQPFESPGPVLTASDHPRLFELLESVARSTEQTMPEEVFLVPQMNAWVSERDVKLGQGGVRIMGLGLPLLQMLSIQELKAVLAHEFGHYYSGDTRVGPWIHRTRSAMGRTLQNLSKHSSLLQRPFLAYGNMFLKVTHGISRDQERVADHLAARLVGSQPLISGLMKVNATAGLVDAYWGTEVVPLLGSGYRPPMASGLEQFMDTEGIREAKVRSLAVAMESKEEDPFDTHPSLSERVDAAKLLPPGEPGDPATGITLLEAWPTMEADLLKCFLKDPHTPLEPIGWDEVGERVLIPRWTEMVAHYRDALAGITAESIPEAMQLSVVVRRLPIAPEESAQATANWILAAGLALALHGNGWSARSPLGGNAKMIRDGEEVFPWRKVAELVEGTLSEKTWREQCDLWGITGTRLVREAPDTVSEAPA